MQNCNLLNKCHVFNLSEAFMLLNGRIHRIIIHFPGCVQLKNHHFTGSIRQVHSGSHCTFIRMPVDFRPIRHVTYIQSLFVSHLQTRNLRIGVRMLINNLRLQQSPIYRFYYLQHKKEYYCTPNLRSSAYGLSPLPAYQWNISSSPECHPDHCYSS
jgi:hypothetical protein